ncbi:steroid 21-hydroxylase [Porphyrio hochstetteri]
MGGCRGGSCTSCTQGGAQHLAHLGRRHGPVLRLRLGQRDVLLLSSVGPIREALVRHWGDWLGRPPSYLGALVSRGGRDLALGDASPGWRRQRAVTRGALARGGGRLRPLLQSQARALCEELRSHGGGPPGPRRGFPLPHLQHHRGAALRGAGSWGGCPPPEEVRAFTRCVLELLEVWGRGSVRALDLLPPLRALPNPGLGELLRLVRLRDAFVEAQIRRHEASPSPPADTVLGGLQGRDPALHMALVDLFIGGTETTAAAMGWALAFLLHRPELQERLWQELCRELGPTGTPQVGDTGRLPLLHAVVTETLRLRPPAPLALPHCARRHTSVGGLPVPSGSILVPNLLAAQQDPDIWHHPQDFLPERFLEPAPPWRALLPFGCGARSCPGEALARAELFVFLGHIVQRFRLEPAAPGALPSLAVAGGGTVLRCPRYRLRLRPRHTAG